MSGRRQPFTTPTGRTVTLVFDSRLARILGGPRGVNNCFTPCAGLIFISRDWVTARGLAHECGHVEQATRLGWRYLPWLLYHEATSGYTGSLPERDADAYMDQWAAQIVGLGPIPEGYT